MPRPTPVYGACARVAGQSLLTELARAIDASIHHESSTTQCCCRYVAFSIDFSFEQCLQFSALKFARSRLQH